MSYGYGGGYGGGGGAAEGGGGFMGGSQGGSQQDGATKTYGKETLRPVTIKQLIDATRPHPDANFIISSVEISTVTFVAQIQSITPQHTNTTYKLDDGTGLIEVKQWTDAEADPDAASHDGKGALAEGMYLRVAGKLKDFNGKRHVGAHLIRRVEDFNEVSYHLLECAVVHLYFTRGAPGSGAGEKQENNGNEQGLFVDSYGGGDDGGNAAQQNQRKAMARMGPNARKVLNLLNTRDQNSEGLHVSQIAHELKMQQSDVFKAGDELLGDGLIFTTVDDETWAILEY